MKNLSILTMVTLAAIFGLKLHAQAEVSVRVGGDRWAVRYRDHDRRSYVQPHHPRIYAHPYRHYRRHHHWRPYYVTPVQPIIIQQPVYAPAPMTPALSGDYGRDLSDLYDRISRLRAVLDRQKEKEGITKDQYDRFTRALDDVAQAQRVRSFDRGGNLEASDFAELHRRVDQVDEDMERALAL